MINDDIVNNYFKGACSFVERSVINYPDSLELKKPGYLLKRMLQMYACRYSHVPENNAQKSPFWRGLEYLGSFFPNYDKERSAFADQLQQKIHDEQEHGYDLTKIFQEADNYLTVNQVPLDSELASIWIAFFKHFPFYANAISNMPYSALIKCSDAALLDNISLLSFAEPKDHPYELVVKNMREKVTFVLEGVLLDHANSYPQLWEGIHAAFPVYHAIDYMLEADKIMSFAKQKQAFQQVILDCNLADKLPDMISYSIGIVSELSHKHFATGCHMLALFDLTAVHQDTIIPLLLRQARCREAKLYTARSELLSPILDLLSVLPIDVQYAESVIDLVKRHFFPFSNASMKILCNLTDVPHDKILTVLQTLLRNTAGGYNHEVREFMLKYASRLSFWDKKIFQMLVQGTQAGLLCPMNSPIRLELSVLSQAMTAMINREFESSLELQREIGCTTQSRDNRFSRLLLD